ncbi:MAG: viroporin-like protein [Cirsium cytorhabdovirus 1]|nr:MAG: viroporin-like protein [Cirsium cytorhabdovirus 1]
MPGMRDAASSFLGLDGPPGDDGFSMDFPELGPDMYHLIIFFLLLLKLVLIIVILRFRRTNNSLRASLKWK